MPVHDLTHLAVESTLLLADAFYGLVADGWNIETFEEPGASRRLPAVALWTEVVVFLLQTELGSGIKQAAPDFNATVSAISGSKHIMFSRYLAAEELAAIRHAVREWCEEWRALAPGEELGFQFMPGTENGLTRVAAN
jgi:hypothetical protein